MRWCSGLGGSRGLTSLSPVKRDVFSGDEGLPFAVAIGFQRDAKGRVSGFTLTGNGMVFEFRKR